MMPEYDDYPQRERGGMDGFPPRERGGMDDYPEPPGGGGDDYPEGDPDYPAGPGPDRMSRRRDPYGRGGRGREVARKNEVVVGKKRFKLYEKKRMNFKRAKEFCKKKDGKLAEG